MRITSMSEVDQVRAILESHFGEMPENVIIESEEVVKECKHYGGLYNRMTFPTFDLRVCGVRVANQIAEVEIL